MSNEITNTADIIDSRDIIARIEELEAEREALTDAVTEADEARTEARRAFESDRTQANRDALTDAEMIYVAAADSLAEWTDYDESAELRALTKLAEQCEGYGGWKDGEMLIRETYFEAYAQELAEDIGAISRDATWPNNCIDWERAARELEQDYTRVDFDGVDYLMRA